MIIGNENPIFDIAIAYDEGSGFAELFVIVVFYALSWAGWQFVMIRVAHGRRYFAWSDYPTVHVVFIISIIVIIALITYVVSYGGLESSLNEAAAIRAGHRQVQRYAFVKRFLVLPVITVTILVGVSLVRRRFNMMRLLAIGSSVALFIICGLLLAGRGRFIVLLLIIFVCISNVRNRPALAMGLVSICIGIPLMILGKPFLNSVASYQEFDILSNIGNSVYIINSLINDFKYPYISLDALVDDMFFMPQKVRHVSDLYYGIVSLVPEQIIPVRAGDSVAYENTMRVSGYYDSDVPPGIVALSIYMFSFAGVVLVPVLLGWIFAKVDSWFHMTRVRSEVHLATHAIIAVTLGYGIMAGEPRVYLQSYVLHWLFFISYIIWTKYKFYIYRKVHTNAILHFHN
ncbi:hypothetical protein [Rubrivirga marina]|uniref:hypothetical protein n=1 Tax=Rubrivirga marina TaxID=1196024 RepID=UPI00117B6313|nr:hypothetical protein [Rubrivirga marina]